MNQKVIDTLGEVIYCTSCNLPVKDYDQGLPLAMMNKIRDLAQNGNTKEEILDYFKNLYGPSSVNDGVNFYISRLNDGFYGSYPIIALSILVILVILLVIFYTLKLGKTQKISL